MPVQKGARAATLRFGPVKVLSNVCKSTVKKMPRCSLIVKPICTFLSFVDLVECWKTV